MASSVLANRVKVATATSGTGTVTLGAKVTNAYVTFAEGGITNGQVITYLIEEGTDFEIGRGTYTSSGTTLSRDTVLLSSSGGTVGTSKLSLAGGATVSITAGKEDLDISDFTEDTSPDLAADYIWTYDASATLKKKVLARRFTGIIRDTVQATTSGTTFDFTSIPSGVRSITVMLNEVSLSGTNNLLVQIGDSEGLETTGYSSASSNNAGGATATIVSSAGFIITSSLAARSISGIMTIANITSNDWVASWSGGSDTGDFTSNGGGFKQLSATLDRVRLLATGADTFDAGAVNIFYE